MEDSENRIYEEGMKCFLWYIQNTEDSVELNIDLYETVIRDLKRPFMIHREHMHAKKERLREKQARSVREVTVLRKSYQGFLEQVPGLLVEYEGQPGMKEKIDTLQWQISRVNERMDVMCKKLDELAEAVENVKSVEDDLTLVDLVVCRAIAALGVCLYEDQGILDKV